MGVSQPEYPLWGFGIPNLDILRVGWKLPNIDSVAYMAGAPRPRYLSRAWGWSPQPRCCMYVLVWKWFGCKAWSEHRGLQAIWSMLKRMFKKEHTCHSPTLTYMSIDSINWYPVAIWLAGWAVMKSRSGERLVAVKAVFNHKICFEKNLSTQTYSNWHRSREIVDAGDGVWEVKCRLVYAWLRRCHGCNIANVTCCSGKR